MDGMDTDRIREAVPHYIAILILAYGILLGIDQFNVQLGFWAELVIIVVVVFLYRFVVTRLGYGPSFWERPAE